MLVGRLLTFLEDIPVLFLLVCIKGSVGVIHKLLDIPVGSAGYLAHSYADGNVIGLVAAHIVELCDILYS